MLCRGTDVRLNTYSRKWYSTLYRFGNFTIRQYDDSTNWYSTWNFGKMTNRWNDVSEKWCDPDYRTVLKDSIPHNLNNIYPSFPTKDLILVHLSNFQKKNCNRDTYSSRWHRAATASLDKSYIISLHNGTPFDVVPIILVHIVNAKYFEQPFGILEMTVLAGKGDSFAFTRSHSSAAFAER